MKPRERRVLEGLRVGGAALAPRASEQLAQRREQPGGSRAHLVDTICQSEMPLLNSL